MVDTKISALPAAASVADADEFEVNQAGTSRKATAGQLRNPSNQTQRLTYVDAGALSGPWFEAFRDSASPAPSDLLGGVAVLGRNSAAAEKVYVRYGAQITDPTDSSEDAIASIWAMVGGAETALANFDIGGIDTTGYEVQGNPVITTARHHQLRPYAVAGLPAATAGQLAEASNAGGGRCPVYGDGANWSRLGDGIAALATDADFTLTYLIDAPTIRHTGVLTADRLITFADNRGKFRITRTGAGAFNLSVGGLKNLVQNTWCDVEGDGAAIRLTAYGAL